EAREERTAMLRGEIPPGSWMQQPEPEVTAQPVMLSPTSTAEAPVTGGLAAPQPATPEAPPQPSPPLAATATPAAPAEAAPQQPPALAWPAQVSFDQDGQVILPKVRRKHQLDAGAK